MLKFFRHIRKRLVDQNNIRTYLLYATGEIFLVVIGILIALQVNNWNEERKRMARFEFGLRELYTSIQSTVFFQDRLTDIIHFQNTRIDSLLYHSEEIPNNRIPGMVLLLDQSGLLGDVNASWISEYLDFDLNDPESIDLSKALINFSYTYNGYDRGLRQMDLNDSMLKLLKKHNLPVLSYSPGYTYNYFIEWYASQFYESALDDNIEALLNDDTLTANLKSIRLLKLNAIQYTDIIESGGNGFLDNIQRYTPDIDYSIKRMEIVGTGTLHGDYGTGIAMRKISEDDSEWELNLELQDGMIKFRTGADWVLDWGRGEDDVFKLVFKGGNIPVTEGFYRVYLNIRENYYSLTKIEMDYR